MNTKFIIYWISFFVLCSCSKGKLEADILIINGTVYNGVDSIPNNHSIAIKKDKIIFAGDLSTVNIEAAKTIDASGLIVSPGFIDPHTHADRDLVNPEKSHNKPFLFQGITTVIVGNDGSSFYPTSKYIQKYETQGIGTNVALLIGQGTIREQVIGSTDRKATKDEVLKIKALVQEEMDAGAIGMSTGLFYSPGSYSSTEEVIELSKVVSKNKGIYDTHLRDEGSYTIGLIPAIEEAIEIGRQADLPIHISHIKCLGVKVWGQSDSIIAIIENARKKGIKITSNQYPYDASATSLKAAVVPRWAERGGKDSLFYRYSNPEFNKQILEETKSNIALRGGPDKLLIVKAPDSSWVGKNLLEISSDLDVEPEKAVFEIIQDGYVRVASFNMTGNDIHNFMKQDWVVTGSDGNTGHPRKYGSFPRKFNTYVKEENIISTAKFINGSSSKTAKILGLSKRGELREGFFADVIIFDPNTFQDKADYTNAFKTSEGLKYSIINGNFSIDKEKFTNKLNGEVIKK